MAARSAQHHQWTGRHANPGWWAPASAWALIGGAIVNCAFLLEGYTGATLDRSISFVSELGARGQPAADFFRLSDLVTGVLLAFGAIGALLLLPANRFLRLGLGLALFFALLTTADAFLPLDCPPTTDPACRAAEEAGDVSWQHAAHNVTGVLEGISAPAALLAIALGSWQLRRRGQLGQEWEPQWQLLTVIGVLYALLSALIAVLYVNAVDGVGVWQRLQIVLYAAGMFTLGLLLRHATDPNDEVGT